MRGELSPINHVGTGRKTTIGLAVLVIAGLLSACGGGSESAATTATPGSDSTTPVGSTEAETTVTTALPTTTTTTTTTIPSSAAIAGIVGDGAVLGDCDWPEAYPEGSDPIIVSWTEVDDRSDELQALRDARGLPAWEMPSTSAEMENPRLWGYAHRTVEVPGSTLVSGAYLFATPELALGALEAVRATFNDAALMSSITGGVAGLNEVIPRQAQENGVAVTIQASADGPYVSTVILGEAMAIENLLVVFRAAVPFGADDSRFRAAMDAQWRLVTRATGSPVQYPTEPLGAVTDFSGAVLGGNDSWPGTQFNSAGTPPSWSADDADALAGLYTAYNGLSVAELLTTNVDMAAAGVVRQVLGQLQSVDGAVNLFSGYQRYTDPESASAGLAAIAAAQAAPAELAVDLETPSLGEESVAVLQVVGGTLEVIGIVWRSGSQVQWLRARTVGVSGPDGAPVANAMAIATVLAERMPDEMVSIPGLNPGCIPPDGSGAGLLAENPWLTPEAVLADGGPWIDDPAGADAAVVVSYEDAQGFTEADWAELGDIQAVWNGSWEVPTSAEWFENEWNPIQSVALRSYQAADGEPTIWSVAVRYQEGVLGPDLGGDQFQDTPFALQGFWSASNNLGSFPDNLGRLSGLEQGTLTVRYPIATPVLADAQTSGLMTGPDIDQKVAFIIWRRGDVVQWVRVLMSASDTTTLDAMLAVAAAMAARSE